MWKTFDKKKKGGEGKGVEEKIKKGQKQQEHEIGKESFGNESGGVGGGTIEMFEN